MPCQSILSAPLLVNGSVGDSCLFARRIMGYKEQEPNPKPNIVVTTEPKISITCSYCLNKYTTKEAEDNRNKCYGCGARLELIDDI